MTRSDGFQTTHRKGGLCERNEYDALKKHLYGGIQGARKDSKLRLRRPARMVSYDVRRTHTAPASAAGLRWRSRCCSDFRPLVWRFGLFIGR